MSKRKPAGYWTLERCMEDAKPFTRRVDWKRKPGTGYWSAKDQGWLDQCCGHMTSKSDSITSGKTRILKQHCIESAAQFSTRSEWKAGDRSNYMAAWRNGWVEDCSTHMERSRGSDNDVVYVWRDDVTGLHKIGITSDRLGEYRIGGDNRDMDPRVVFMLKVNDARAVESKLLELGTDPELDSSIDGYTEFRRLTDAQLGQAVSIAYEAALAA